MAITYKGMPNYVLQARTANDQVVTMDQDNVKRLLIAWLFVVTNRRFWDPSSAPQILLDSTKITEAAQMLDLTPATIQYLLNLANDSNPDGSDAGTGYKFHFQEISKLFSTIGKNGGYGDQGCPIDPGIVLSLAQGL